MFWMRNKENNLHYAHLSGGLIMIHNLYNLHNIVGPVKKYFTLANSVDLDEICVFKHASGTGDAP